MTQQFFLKLRFSLFNSIGSKLFLYVLAGALVGLGGMSYFFYQVFEDRAKDEILSTLKTQVTSIDGALNRIEESMIGLSSAVTSMHKMGISDPEAYKKLAFEFFQKRPKLVVGNGFGQAPFQIVPSHQWYWPYFYVDQNEPDAVGQLLPAPHNTIRSAELFSDDNYPEQDYYTVPFAENKSLWSEPYDWYGITMTSFLNAFFDEQGKVIGVAGADVNVTALSEQVSDSVIREGGYFAILNKQGRLLSYSPDPEKAKARVSYQQLPLLSEIWPQIQQEQFGLLEVGGTFLGYQRIPSTQWLMVAIVPQSLVLGPVFAITVMGTLGAGIVLALVVVLFVRRLNRRLQPILDECNKWGKALISGGDELEVLDRSFHQMATQLKASFETLEAKNAELQRLDQIKDEFLANTSHELRTPLNGIIGIAESLIDGATGQLGDQTQANLAMIVGSGKRLSALVNDILDFSKLKHQTLELQLKPIALREIVEIVLTLSQPLVTKVQLINDVAEDLPLAHADENRLQQILHNLVGNAIKFTDSGCIEISAKVVNHQLEMCISDTGIGIAGDKLDRIFESFEQAEGSTAREYGGTGLGLAVTKQLVELHGGCIRVESQLGVGSQFFFTMSISEEKASPQLSTPQLSKIDALATGMLTVAPVTTAQFTILIVDDEPVNLQVLNNFLSLQNYHIIQASNGSEALSIIEKGLKPDAILLDVMMPHMTGYEVTQKIREKWQADEVPILLLTAKNQLADLVTGLELGANDYLTKPFSKDELLARLKTHINIKCLKAENMRMSAELEVTRKIQQMLLPKEQELEQVVNLEMAGFMEPAEEVGGDYYDVLQHNGRFLFGIGDATGHGLESGLLALMTQAAVRTLLEHGETDAVKFLNSLNGMIYKNVQERLLVDKNLTLSLLEYQPPSFKKSEGILRICGQHEDIIVVRNGSLERLETDNLGFPVGLVSDITEYVAQTEVTLKKGDVVVLYTDGITEAENPERKEYGIERLCEVVKQHWQTSANRLREMVINDVRQYIGEQKVFDDMTLLILKQK